MIKRVEFEQLVVEKIWQLRSFDSLKFNSGQVPVQNQQQVRWRNVLGRCSGVFIADFEQRFLHVKLLMANPIRWSNTHKHFVGNSEKSELYWESWRKLVCDQEKSKLWRFSRQANTSSKSRNFKNKVLNFFKVNNKDARMISVTSF